MEQYSDYGIDLPDNFHGDRKVRCPKCSHTRRKKTEPCLSVNGDKHAWLCHNCGWSGCLKEEKEFKPTRREYRRPAPEVVTTDCDPHVAAYFQQRGIGPETLNKCRIFSTTHYLNGTGTNTLCMAFPYYRNGELVNVKYRDARKNMAQEKDPEPCLWNIDSCKEADIICITEGEIDALTLVECGFSAAVSVDKGAPNGHDADATKKLECVANCLETLQNADSVVLVTDKDEPGLRLERELINAIGPAKCKLVHYPSECKDINDVLVSHGKEIVREIIANAEPAPVPGLHEFGEFSVAVNALYKSGHPKGVSTGWAEFDRFFTLKPGTLNVMTGIPQSGKSEFVHALAVNTIKLHGWKWAIFSPEMLPVENLFSNFAEKIIGKPFFGPDRMTPEELDRAMRMCNDAIKVLLPDDDETPGAEEIIAAARVCVARYGIKGLIIDPYNEIEHTRPAWQSETEYISQFLGKMRKLARRYGLWVCIVAHPTKLKKDERTKKFPVPSLYDISGSSNWWNKPDGGLSLWRDHRSKSNAVEVHVQKVKSKGVGTAGTVQKFDWDYKTGRFLPSLPGDNASAPYGAEDEPISLPYKD